MMGIYGLMQMYICLFHKPNTNEEFSWKLLHIALNGSIAITNDTGTNQYYVQQQQWNKANLIL